jgi:GxxExxY protein
MNRNEVEFIDTLVDDVVGAANEVAETVGGGFLEPVYRRALLQELVLRGRSVKSDALTSLMYKGASVADYSADMVVNGRVAVALRCAGHVSRQDIEECGQFLKMSGLYVALVLNFQDAGVECERVVNAAESGS